MGGLKASEKASPAAWQLGYELERLRAYAAPFKEALGPFCRGAFSGVKERDIAEALKRGELAVAKDGEAIGAAALFSCLKQASRRKDCSGREAPLLPGDVLVRALAWPQRSASPLLRLLRALQERANAGSGVLWLEVFEEDQGLGSMLKDAGFQWALTKVSAASELIGLYCAGPGAEARLAEIPKREPCEELPLACLFDSWCLPMNLAAMLAEARAEGERFVQHYAVYNKRKSWTALALRGFGDESFIEKPAEMSKAWKAEHPELLKATPAWTAAAKRCPSTASAADSVALFGLEDGPRLERVRYMRLAPGGELTRHADITDRDAGLADGRIARLHIPLASSPGCRFSAWDDRGRRHEAFLAPGSLWYLDQRRPHAVKNESSEERVHLVIDLASSSKLRRLFA